MFYSSGYHTIIVGGTPDCGGFVPSIMTRTDPYDPGEPYYECTDCQDRIAESVVEGKPDTCPKCGGDVKNINVPRD